MFPHVTSQKHLSVFLRLHPMEAECVCEYDNSDAKADSPWSKKMENKVGIIPHRPDKPNQSLRDIGTCKQKRVSE
jgi:hypothetical protein